MAYFNPFRPAYLEDPYPALAELRRQEPVHRSRDLGAWVLTSYEHCLQVLHDDETFSSDPASAGGEFGAGVRRKRQEIPAGAAPILGNSDPPDHDRLRAIVNRAFTPTAIAAMRPRIEAAVEGILAGVGPGKPFEVMSGFAEFLVVSVVLEHLGVPVADRAKVRDWSMALMRARAEGSLDPAVVAAAAAAREQLAGYLSRPAPTERTTVIEALQRAAASDEPLSPDEMVMLLVHISLAGNGPTAYAIGNAVLNLGRHPQQLARLGENPDPVPAAVEELLRFDSPTHIVARFVRRPAEIAGRSLKPGDSVYAVVGAANRDPARFPDPDVLDFGRADNRHLSFGMGIHHCLGAPLARLELDVALRALVLRYGVFSLSQVVRGGNLFTRGPQAVVIAAG